MRSALVATVIALVACRDHGVAPPRTALADSADQVLAGMTHTITHNGLRNALVQADSAWLYDPQKIYDLKRMTVTMYDSSGAALSRITADKGIYYIRDQKLDARGNVVATSSEGRVLKTEHLVYDNLANVIMSDTAFTSTSPKGNASGARFSADPGFKRLTIDHPHNLYQKGKGIPLGSPGGGQP